MVLCWAACAAATTAIVAQATLASERPAEGSARGERAAQVFPVRGPHWTRGPVGDFGAPRTGGRTHIGFDLMAACGTKLVSAWEGRVLKRAYRPDLDGNYVVIHARRLGRNYWYSHLRKPALPREGDFVERGQRIGSVGKSGNARSVGCHLHFEIHVRGRVVDPEPALRRWDRQS